MIASAAAWALNPTNPPFYLDLPVKNGEARPDVAERLSANALLALLDQYIYAIRGLRGFGFDAGDKDTSIAASIRVLDERLRAYGVPHKFAIYDGDHVNRVEQRIETEMLRFSRSCWCGIGAGAIEDAAADLIAHREIRTKNPAKRNTSPWAKRGANRGSRPAPAPGEVMLTVHSRPSA